MRSMVEGARPRRIFLRRKWSDESDAPTIALRAVPLPRYHGGRLSGYFTSFFPVTASRFL